MFTQHADNRAKLNSPLAVVPGDLRLQLCCRGEVFPERRLQVQFSSLKGFTGRCRIRLVFVLI